MEIKPNVRYPVHTDAAILHPGNLRLVRVRQFFPTALSLVRCGETLLRRQHLRDSMVPACLVRGGLTDKIALIQGL